MWWRCLALLVCALLAWPAGPLLAQQVPDGLDPDQLQQIQLDVIALRGLEPTRPTPVILVSSEEMDQHIEAMFRQRLGELPGDTVQAARAFQRLMGFSRGRGGAPAPALQQGSRVAGLYAPEEGVMYVVTDNGTFGDFEQDVYAHEFTHALQDQHFQTGLAARQMATNPDQAAAFHALLEGDATFIEEQWASDHLDPDEIKALGIGWEEAAADRVGLYPRAYQTSLQFMYGAGARLVRQAYERAGNTTAGIDALYADPPLSTAQVLHPEQYWSHQKPVEVSLPDLPTRLGGGWRTLSSSVYGELGLDLLLQRTSSARTAAAATDGWRGDRLELLTHGADEPALAFRSTWNTPSDARQFFDAFANRLHRQLAQGEVEEATTSRLALTSDTEAADLRLAGSDVVLGLAVDRVSADAVMGALGVR